MKRVYMTDGYRVALPHGGMRRFRGDEFYLLDDDDADELIDEQVAYDEDHPPACGYCGETFEGQDAYSLRDAHEADEHPRNKLDDLTKDELKTQLVARGGHPDEVEGSGADGNVLKDDLKDAIVDLMEA